MRRQKGKSKSRVLPVITLLLVSGFVFTVTMLSKAIGDPEVTFTTGGPIQDVYKKKFVDEENGAAAAWLNGWRVFDGEKIGSVSTYIGASVYTDENDQLVVYYYADANSGISHSDFHGSANAWVSVPNKPQVGGGDKKVGKGFPITSVSAWDSNTIDANLAGGKSMTASAALSAKGARVSVKIHATGI